MANIEDQSKGITDSVGTGAALEGQFEETLASTDALAAVVPNGVVTEAAQSSARQQGNGEGDVLKVSGIAADSSNVARPTPNGTAGSSHVAVNMPHAKKFSAVNINKKFLEKNASLPGSSPSTSALMTTKLGSSAPKQTLEVSNSHSRLVTAKLTSTPRPSSTTGPGWSRPSSVAPSSSTPAPSSNVNKLPTLPANPGAPQLPHVGKVIQPQPRASVAGSSTTVLIRETLSVTTRPAWGSLNNGTTTTLKPDMRVQSDFPTAAEVAQVRTSKLSEMKAVAQEQDAHKQALQEEADTFRGVHLDPNAHHWDEMEEDDDNFLGGVIDFGDGRQYQIQPNDASAASAASQQPSKPTTLDNGRPVEQEVAVAVSKEERFVDDFDRSWPRSRRPASPNESDTSRSSQALRSPLESSRVLFNERSNRLEPYSGPAQRHPSPNQLHPALSSRRNSRSDQVASPADSRSQRDLPPHSQVQNVSLLQKPEASSSWPRGPHPGAALSPTLPTDRWRDHPPPRSATSSTFVPMSRTVSQTSSGARGKDHYNPLGVHGERPRDTALENRHRRLSASHPPPIPLPVAQPPRDATRQLPPHLMGQSHDKLPPPRALSPQPPLPPQRALSPEPIVDNTAPEAAPPTLPVVIDEEVRKAAMHSGAERARLRRQQEEEERERERERARRKAAELEEKMKALAAEKVPGNVEEAKQETVTEQQIIKTIQDAVHQAESIVVVTPASDPSDITGEAHPPAARTPGLPPAQRVVSRHVASQPPTTRRVSFPAASAAPMSNATVAESWRSKATPVTSEPQSSKTEFKAGHLLHQSITEAESLHVNPDEQLEVFDFADLGKLIGGRHSPVPPTPAQPQFEDVTADRSSRVRPARPVASDFFDELPPARVSEPSWRRKPEPPSEPAPSSSTIPPSTHLGQAVKAPEHSPEFRQDATTVHTTTSSMTVAAPSSPSLKHTTPRGDHVAVFSQSITSQASAATQRSPRFKEASMSILDDTMSRIKGVLADMHVHDHHDDKQDDQNSSRVTGKSQDLHPVLQADMPPKSKFVPPALRPKPPTVYELPIPDEVFDVTGAEPPRSPKPAWSAFVVHLPELSHTVEPLSRRQLNQFRNHSHVVRWDILSWNPPVEGMNRRFLSVDPILFPKGKPRYRVLLPRIRPTITAGGTEQGGIVGPKVNLPLTPGSKIPGNLPSLGAFGRPRGADSATSWRQVSRTTSTGSRAADNDSSLQTVSRSPPPDPPLDLPSGHSGRNEHPPQGSGEPQSPQSPRPKSQPRMPSGSSVAFYKDARVNIAASDIKPTVNFTVTSELDESSDSISLGRSSQEPESIRDRSAGSVPTGLPMSSSPHVNGPKERLKPGRPLPNDTQANHHRKTQGELVKFNVDSSPPPQLINIFQIPKSDGISKPPHSSDVMWGMSSLMLSMKDSSARGPDPEHLKIVWSQASDKANLPSINSLEGIGDDLTALPFTVPDVKSEDGETPPPTAPGVPSRMSAQDVARAFQQVPSSSSASTSSQRTPLSPPSNFSVPRPVPLPYSLPQQSNMRPAYAPYPSPMLNSPSPTIIYPHHMAPSPVPGRMSVNGHAPPQYSTGTAVWVPPPPQAPAPGGGMMRPMPAGYPIALMSYPSPMASPMYPVPGPPMHMQAVPASQPNGTPNRPGTMPMMSPVMSHGTPANPMYSGSPVMVHASHLPISHNQYTPVPPSHTQPRPLYDNASSVPSRPAGHQQPNGYASTPSTAFTRSAW